MALLLAEERTGDFVGDPVGRDVRRAGAARARLRARARGWRRARRSTLDDPVTTHGMAAERRRGVARAGAVLLRPVRVEGVDDRGARARAQGARRAAELGGPGAARGGRRAGGDRARERPALPPAAPQGRGTRADAGVQREHPRIARRRPRGGGRARTACIRWNRALEQLHGVTRADAVGADARRAVRAGLRRGGAGRRASSPRRAARSTGSRSTRRPAATPGRSSTSPPSRCSRPRAAADDRHGRHRRRRDGAGAARGAAADLRQDGVDRPAGGRRGARGEHAADRHLQLHADAARRRRPRRSEDAPAREDRAPDVPRGEDRQRPAEPVAPGDGRARARAGRPERRRQRRAVAARAPVQGRAHPGAARDADARAGRARHRVQAAAGVPEPVHQRPRRHAQGRLAVDRARGWPTARPSSRWATPAPASRASCLARIYDPFFTTKTIGQGTGPRPVDHLRHRAGARRHDHVRQRGRGRHPVHAVVPARGARVDRLASGRAV